MIAKHPVRLILYFCLSVLLFSSLAHAGPGWDVTSFATSPNNAPKLVAAIDEWMAAGGKEYPGVVTLYLNEADGTDPATHTIVATFPSAAAAEAFSQKVQANEKMSAAWAKLMGVFSDNTTLSRTMRGSFVRSWGEADPGDGVWMHHMITATDPGGVVAALDRWMDSPTGKKAPGQMHLSGVVAGGMGSPSHLVSVGYASQAEMEQWNDSLTNNEDWQAFLVEVGQASEYHGANLSIRVKAWGTPPAQTASR